MRRKPLLACAASVLAASATFAAGGTASAADPAGATATPANMSDFLARQLTTLSGRTTVMVHGTSLTAARDAVATAGMAKTGEFASIGVVIVTNPPGQDPTGGILSVASYFDQDTGTREGVVSEYSSRDLSSDGTTSYDNGYGLVDVVAAVAALG